MRKTCTAVIFCICLLGAYECSAFAGQYVIGKVARCIDGDSLIVRENGLNREIRLWGIDCPEYNQAYAVAARNLCKRLVGNRQVRVEIKNTDSYGRLVGVVYLENFNMNEELVRQGAAWVYGRYCQESICQEWKELEKTARSKKTGLWHEKNVTAPWKWRRAKG